MLKLILADNQAIFRAGAAKVLAVEDEIRIVAQAQTTEQATMALEKFRASVLVFSTALQSDIKSIVEAATKCNTKVMVVAENGENARRSPTSGAKGRVCRRSTGTGPVS